jgi:hypothetical protein
MVQLVLLPVYGTWLNEDFAAVQPQHRHIFLAGVKLNHHPPDAHHPGQHGRQTTDSEGVVNVPDQDAAGLGLLFLLFICGATAVIPHNTNSLHAVWITTYTLLRGISPPPLEQPPRH